MDQQTVVTYEPDNSLKKGYFPLFWVSKYSGSMGYFKSKGKIIQRGI